jgi:hypothetical protein
MDFGHAYAAMLHGGGAPVHANPYPLSWGYGCREGVPAPARDLSSASCKRGPVRGAGRGRLSLRRGWWLKETASALFFLLLVVIVILIVIVVVIVVRKLRRLLVVIVIVVRLVGRIVVGAM